MNTLYVRVAPKSGNKEFYRCATLFTLLWLMVTVDDATAQRLQDEQMLEVSDVKPDDYLKPDGYVEAEHTQLRQLSEDADAELEKSRADADAAEALAALTKERDDLLGKVTNLEKSLSAANDSVASLTSELETYKANVDRPAASQTPAPTQAPAPSPTAEKVTKSKAK